ncbi:MAG: hypothetical protein LBL85_00290 [Methanocalculaceae archaeon]|jgi:hypothetical protein|nr:hypothetical protein [Methanocalculaceae archaeon]
MKHLLLRIHLPLSGVALGTAALGSLLQNYSDIVPPSAEYFPPCSSRLSS